MDNLKNFLNAALKGGKSPPLQKSFIGNHAIFDSSIFHNYLCP